MPRRSPRAPIVRHIARSFSTMTSTPARIGVPNGMAIVRSGPASVIRTLLSSNNPSNDAREGSQPRRSTFEFPRNPSLRPLRTFLPTAPLHHRWRRRRFRPTRSASAIPERPRRRRSRCCDDRRLMLESKVTKDAPHDERLGDHRDQIAARAAVLAAQHVDIKHGVLPASVLNLQESEGQRSPVGPGGCAPPLHDGVQSSASAAGATRASASA